MFRVNSAAPAAREHAGPDRLQVATPAYRRALRAMFIGGFATFATLYSAQPLMPLLAAEFRLSPAAASGAVSAATAAVAFMLIPGAAAANRYGRKPVMGAALLAAALFSAACALAGSYGELLVWRTLVGMALAGLPAVAMTYLGEEVDGKHLAGAMSAYIAGNALGGMSGRFAAALIADWTSWRIALGVIAAAGFLMAIEFWRSLPASRHFRQRPTSPGALWSELRQLLADRTLLGLFAMGFLLMGCFVSYYNYLAFRLTDQPHGFSTGQVGAVFMLYLLGVVAPGASVWKSRRFGRRGALALMLAAMAAGIALSVAAPLAAIIAGTALFTFGFFGAHAVAASWVSRRAAQAGALAAALYLCSYYLGASVIGSASGVIWKHGGWNGIALGLAVALLACALAARSLPREG